MYRCTWVRRLLNRCQVNKKLWWMFPSHLPLFFSSYVLLRGIINYLVGPTVHTKAYIFRYFYQQYLVLFTMMVPRNIIY